MASSAIDTVVSLCKRRGFVFPSGEIYGGTRSAWDYGPLGVELKENIKRQWWRSMVTSRDDVVGLDSSVILPTKTWEASGHLATFSDPLTECQSCHKRFRADHLQEAAAAKKGIGNPDDVALADITCPHCGIRGAWTEPRDFNGMLKTYLGVIEDDSGLHYLRPETAQGIFLNFVNVMNSARKKPPFGIAQTGKVFRNEITPGNFIFRVLEFEQMEIEYFSPPEEGETYFERMLDAMNEWTRLIGLDPEHLRVREHEKEKLSHYSTRTVDIEYLFPGSLGWGELYGLANRTDFDLRSHQEASGVDLSYFDQANNVRYLPHVIEPTFGVERTFLTVLLDAYDEEETVDVNGKADTRVLLRLDPKIAPFKAAILPLTKKPELTSLAWSIYERIQDELSVLIDYDETANIGKRYRRQDEIGTPFCFTVDFESLEDHAVTVRDRDTTAQERISIDDVVVYLKGQLRG